MICYILTRWVPLVEQELPTHPEHLSSPQVFSAVCVTWSLVLYVCFVDRCLSFCTFSLGHCGFCTSSIYVFWLPLWYHQTLLSNKSMSPLSKEYNCHNNVDCFWFTSKKKNSLSVWFRIRVSEFLMTWMSW